LIFLVHVSQASAEPNGDVYDIYGNLLDYMCMSGLDVKRIPPVYKDVITEAYDACSNQSKSNSNMRSEDKAILNSARR
jgi:hypothetical protein